jgi:Uroporphyrinogen decarboxylase (URO-D)
MPDKATPRQMLKALVRGEALARPLLLPVVFSLGSRLENLPLPNFLKNPTKIANASRQIRSTLKIDGLTCYWDPLLEVEAFGGNSESNDTDRMRQTLEKSGGISRMGRIPVAVEALQRLKVMLKDDPALMVRVTGPYSLAMQLASHSNSPPGEILEFAAEVTSSLVNSYLEAGADVVFLTENTLPKSSTNDFERWKALLDPVVNVIRFFEALPVLLFDQAISSEDRERVRRHAWDCAICVPAETGKWQGAVPWVGIHMQGLEVARSEDEAREWAASILKAASAIQVSFLTSLDVAAASDPKSLTRALSALRAQMGSVA